MKRVKAVDIVFGASWGDEGKGKITHQLANRVRYDAVARWNGGANAGHTIYHNGVKFATHLIPSGVFHGIKSVIGPGCVLNINSFMKEVETLQAAGIDTNLIRVHPGTNIVTDAHIQEDKDRLGHLGTTSQGIAPAYRDKYGRTGLLAKDSLLDKRFIMNEPLEGRILCEGAQGFHLDINFGPYPYVTSSECLPYAACSLGFAPQKITNIVGCAKAYDTRVGTDPLFPESLLEDKVLRSIADLGKEWGTTTGRRRKVNWLNMDKLTQAVVIGGATHLVINKLDILEEIGVFKVLIRGKTVEFDSSESFCSFVTSELSVNAPELLQVVFSRSPSSLEANLILK